MANLIRAVANVSKDYASSVASNAVQGVLPYKQMSGAAYSLGLVGPVIKNVVDELRSLKEKEKKAADPKKQEKNADQQVKLLTEIRDLQLKQLDFFTGSKTRTKQREDRMEAGTNMGIAGGMAAANDPSAKGEGFGSLAKLLGLGGLGAGLRGLIPGLIRGAAASLGLGTVYNQLFGGEGGEGGVAGSGGALAAGTGIAALMAGRRLNMEGIKDRIGSIGKPPVAATLPPNVVPIGRGVPAANDEKMPKPMTKPPSEMGKAAKFGTKAMSFLGRGLGYLGAGQQALEGDFLGAGMDLLGTRLVTTPNPYAMAAGALLLGGNYVRKNFFSNTSPSATQQPSTDAIEELLRKEEGKNVVGGRHKAYNDAGGKQTIGYGHLITEYERENKGVKIGGRFVPYEQGLTEDQAVQLLKQDIKKAEDGIKAYLGKELYEKLKPNQKSALTSFVFNVGAGKLKSSGIKEALQKGDEEGAARAIQKGTATVKGVENKGLVQRREREASLFSQGAASAQVSEAPKIDPDSITGKFQDAPGIFQKLAASLEELRLDGLANNGKGGPLVIDNKTVTNVAGNPGGSTSLPTIPSPRGSFAPAGLA